MITGELKNKVDRIWENFLTAGLTNPLSVIEQLTYLMFIKLLDEQQMRSEAEAEILGTEIKKYFKADQAHLRWHVFKHYNAEEMYKNMVDHVFPFIKDLSKTEDNVFANFMKDAIFQIPTPQMLQRVVTGIDELNIEEDLKGDIYEYLLSKISASGTNGQFRTPKHIVDMIVELVEPKPEDIISDPSVGTGNFLVSCSEYLNKHYREKMASSEVFRHHYSNSMFHGNDMDSTMLRIASFNLILHNVEKPKIQYMDSLSKSNEERAKYSLILTRPPFTGSLDFETVSEDILRMTNTKNMEILFLALVLLMLKNGGRGAVIVPDVLLFNNSEANQAIRKIIVDENKLHGVISLPSGIFKPYSGVSSAILLFTKTGGMGGTEEVWFYDMTADGYSLDSKRTPIKQNDIPEIIRRFKHLEGEHLRERTESSFMVPVEEIRQNDYDLSVNRYKKIIYEQVDYEEPTIILDKIKSLENDISEGLEKLARMVE